MRVEDLRIVFKPVDDGAVWETLITRTVSTVYLVRVPHAELGHTNTPDQDGLAEKVQARALELFEQQPEPQVIVGPCTETEFTHWAQEGSASAEQARGFYARLYEPGADDDGIDEQEGGTRP